MRSFISINSLYIIAASIYTASALGINWRGSLRCHDYSWKSNTGLTATETIRSVVLASNSSLSTVYNSGEHISCISSAGAFHDRGVCLFPQGAALTLTQIRPLVDALIDWGCKECGSVPIHFVDQGSNDPAPGILTFNHVNNPKCYGNCMTLPTGGIGIPEIPLFDAIAGSPKPRVKNRHSSASPKSKVRMSEGLYAVQAFVILDPGPISCRPWDAG